jgi:hypothetical protein
VDSEFAASDWVALVGGLKPEVNHLLPNILKCS